VVSSCGVDENKIKKGNLPYHRTETVDRENFLLILINKSFA